MGFVKVRCEKILRTLRGMAMLSAVLRSVRCGVHRLVQPWLMAQSVRRYKEDTEMALRGVPRCVVTIMRVAA